MKPENPKIVESFDDIEIYKKDALINMIGIAAMNEEKKKNKDLGIPAAFMHNGKILYELPDGTITTESPWGSDRMGTSTGSSKIALSEEPLKRVWENEDDDVYN